MYLYKKILILFIIFVSSYIMHILLKKRRGIQNLEGLSNYSDSYEVDLMKVVTGTNISSITTNTDLPLCEFCVKSSYNSALSGNYVGTEAIKYVLSRGCRFIDFEIYYIDNVPCVAYSTDPTFVTLTSKNFITLNEALQTVAMNAFSAPSPNLGDPLFMQLRIKSKNDDILNQTGMAIKNYLSSRLFKGKVDSNTKLKDLLGQIILIIDTKYSPLYKDENKYPKCTTVSTTEIDGCYNLSKYVNMESGGNNLHSYNYNDLLNQNTTPLTIIDSDRKETDVALLRLIKPNIESTNNPEYHDFIVNYGVQFITYRFYLKDKNLEDYEKLFFDMKSGIIPLSSVLNHLNQSIKD